VPRIIPACVIAGVVSDPNVLGDTPPGASTVFARPKSRTLTVPSLRTLMFAGLRSRWTIPCSWAASSASAIWRASGSASSIGTAPRAIRIAGHRGGQHLDCHLAFQLRVGGLIDLPHAADADGAVIVKTPSCEPRVRGMPVQYTGQRGAARQRRVARRLSGLLHNSTTEDIND